MSLSRCSTIFALYCLLLLSVSSPVCAETAIRIGGSGTGAMKLLSTANLLENSGVVTPGF